MTDEEDERWENYDSGPFCKHWADPYDCDELCKCSHVCAQHSAGAECNIEECACEEFRNLREEYEAPAITHTEDLA